MNRIKQKYKIAISLLLFLSLSEVVIIYSLQSSYSREIQWLLLGLLFAAVPALSALLIYLANTLFMKKRFMVVTLAVIVLAAHILYGIIES